MNTRVTGSRRTAALVTLLLLGGPLGTERLPAAQATSAPAAKSSSLPARLTDAEFWKLVSDVSEPGGYFRITDNYTSNEREIGVWPRCCAKRASRAECTWASAPSRTSPTSRPFVRPWRSWWTSAGRPWSSI